MRDAGLSVLEIGRQISDLERTFDVLDRYEPEQSAQSLDTIVDRIEALTELALTAPALSLADAAVQIIRLMTVLDKLASNESEAWELSHGIRRAARVLAGMLPVIASAADVSISEIGGDEWHEKAHAREFPQA